MNLPHLKWESKAQKAYKERMRQATIDWYARQRMLKSEAYKMEKFLDEFTRLPHSEDLSYFPNQEVSDDVLDLLP